MTTAIRIGKFSELTKSTATLEQVLLELCKYGEPRLSKHDSGWYCIVDVFVQGEGVKFEVKTDFKEPTPLSAVISCHDRLLATLRNLSP